MLQNFEKRNKKKGFQKVILRRKVKKRRNWKIQYKQMILFIIVIF